MPEDRNTVIETVYRIILVFFLVIIPIFNQMRQQSRSLKIHEVMKFM